MKKRGPWRIHSEREVYANRFMAVREYEVALPSGAPGLYGVMSPRNYAIAVLPVHEDGSVTLVGQHRFPLDRYSWEIPEGGGAKDVDPQTSGARELREETGLSAARWREILRADLSNSLSDEEAFGYIAWQLSQGEAAPDESEDLALRKIHFLDLLDEIHRSEIRDALTVVMALRAYYMAQTGALQPELARILLNRPD